MVIPTLGKSPWLEATLAALASEADRLRALERASVEVVLVRQGGQGPPPDGADRVVEVEESLGFAAATNLGLRAAGAGAEMVATVNDDLVVETGWLEALLEALDEVPEAAAAQGVNLSLDDPAVADGCGLALNDAFQAVQIGHGRPAPPPTAPRREIFGVSATAAVYRCSALTPAGGDGEELFDPALNSYYEDVELAVRLRSAGWTALLVPRARSLHAGSATGATLPVRRWSWVYGNRHLVLARLLGSGYGRRVPALLLRDLADLARALLSGQLRRALGVVLGLGRAVRRLPRWMHGGAPLIPVAELDRFRVES